MLGYHRNICIRVYYSKVIGLSDNFTIYVIKNIIHCTCVENAMQYKCHAFIFSLEYRMLIKIIDKTTHKFNYVYKVVIIDD